MSVLLRRNEWAANDPEELSKVLAKIEELRGSISVADAIVLAGNAAVEKAAADAGFSCERTFHRWTRRCDRTSKPMQKASSRLSRSPMVSATTLKTKLSVKTEDMMIDKAHLLGLSLPELTVLVGGLRALGAVSGNTGHGVFTDRVGVLSTDFFTNLLDMSTKWTPVDGSGDEEYVGCRSQGPALRSSAQPAPTSSSAPTHSFAHRLKSMQKAETKRSS